MEYSRGDQKQLERFCASGSTQRSPRAQSFTEGKRGDLAVMRNHFDVAYGRGGMVFREGFERATFCLALPRKAKCSLRPALRRQNHRPGEISHQVLVPFVDPVDYLAGLADYAVAGFQAFDPYWVVVEHAYDAVFLEIQHLD